MKPTTIENEKSVCIEFYSSDTKGIGGIIKKDKNDFKVIEDSDVESDEKGEHLCIVVEKEDLTTENFIAILGDHLHLDRRFIGYAGNKDKNAVTVQKISIPYSDEISKKTDELSLIDKFTNNDKDTCNDKFTGKFKITEKFRIKRKIRLGYLNGNFFEIYVRNCNNVQAETTERSNKILTEISNAGVPNYFGVQRFGANYDTHIYGRHLVLREYEKLLEMLKKDNLFSRMIKDTNDHIRAVRSLPYFFLDIFIAGYQSYLFNKILSEKMKNFGLNRIEGDYVNSKQDVVLPIIGYKSKFPTGETGEIINKVMEKERITKEIFKHEIKFLSRKGDLRKINLNFKDFGYEVIKSKETSEKSDVRFKFWLEKGNYATVLMREFCKN
ncbi:MAG: tRNA pseudouridine(13) synthase TruD [Candidatus Altarchaeum sp.]|nr:tRNA pseudouridine(13) synthase TruD [Candidatus Altarchaeum sp.]